MLSELRRHESFTRTESSAAPSSGASQPLHWETSSSSEPAPSTLDTYCPGGGGGDRVYVPKAVLERAGSLGIHHSLKAVLFVMEGIQQLDVFSLFISTGQV